MVHFLLFMKELESHAQQDCSWVQGTVEVCVWLRLCMETNRKCVEDCMKTGEPVAMQMQLFMGGSGCGAVTALICMKQCERGCVHVCMGLCVLAPTPPQHLLCCGQVHISPNIAHITNTNAEVTKIINS